MRILFAASECTPFVKTGGLADVLGSLPGAIAAALQKNQSENEPEVVVVLPKYSLIDPNQFSFSSVPGKLFIPVGDRIDESLVWSLHLPEKDSARKQFLSKMGMPERVAFYFIDNKRYFDRPKLYTTAEGDFEDNDERFIFFSRAVLEFCKLIDFRPDVIHCHDWQTGLIPAYLKTLYKMDAFFCRTASLFTIHNIAYQGLFPKQTLFLAGFGWNDFTPDKLEYYEQISFMKAGIVYADKISTVSPAYAKEIQNDPESGRGMEGVLKIRSADVAGILNGLGDSHWDPNTDPFISVRFSLESKDVTGAKSKCKQDLQKTVQLPILPSVPLIGMVCRLDPQKGFSLLLELLPKWLNQKMEAQWIILGTGDKEIENSLIELQKRFPQNLAIDFTFNDPLAHKIYAGADLFFMPSQFEPCGLGQMIAMQYGTIPVVTPTGGLLDTVIPFSVEQGVGSGFIAEQISAPGLEKALLSALKIYENKTQWQTLVRNAMSQSFSWKKSATEYLTLYEKAIAHLSAL